MSQLCRGNFICCCCGKTINATHIILIHKRAPIPGTGWGCDLCNLPPDGAISTVCNDCYVALPHNIELTTIQTTNKIRFAVRGTVGISQQLTPIESLTDDFKCDQNKHIMAEKEQSTIH